MVDEEYSVTLEAIKSQIFLAFNVNLSISTINRALGSFNYFFKRIEMMSARRNNSDNIEARYRYAIDFIAFDIRKINFVDEFGIFVVTRCAYGRAEVGSTPRKIVSSIISRNISVSAAICSDRLLQ